MRRFWNLLEKQLPRVAAGAIVVTIGCARTDIYYPSDGKSVVTDDRGRVSRHHNRAVVLNGSDALGNTVIDVTRGGVRVAIAGGIDNSTTSREGYRTIRHGVATAGWIAGAAVIANAASSAYSSNQGQTAVSNAAASKSASQQAATQAATRVRLAEIQAQSAAQATRAAARAAAPAAGSTINAVVPAVVTPVVP